MEKRCCARAGFTLVELLVVIGVIAVLLAVLMPALGQARREALRVKCLASFRSLQIAHTMYMSASKNHMIRVGLGHGGAHADEQVAWINTLEAYYGNKLMARSPVDNSPHWPVELGGHGVPVPGSGGTQFRRTSYGVNPFLDEATVPWGGPYRRITDVRAPAATVHFVFMAEEGEFAGADHPHVELWRGSNPPAQAARHLQLHAHGGEPRTWDATTNYGYLDGHAETRAFKDVFTDFEINQFDPAKAQ